MRGWRLFATLAVGLQASCGPGSDVEPPPAPEIRPLVLNDGDRRAAPDSGNLLEDIDGQTYGSLAEPGRWTALFFVRTDCPISNQYAPEIRRICADYGEDGVRCFLVYIDGSVTAEDVRRHTEEYAHTLPAILDSDRRSVREAGATITPEVAVFAEGGELRYRGRIDNLHAALGRPRRQATVRDLRNALDALVGGRQVATPFTQATGCYIE